MTTPATGAPDWQAFSSLHGAALLDEAVVVSAGTTDTLGEWDTSSWPAVHVEVNPSLNGGVLTLLSTETASNLPDSIAGQWVIRPQTRLMVTAPLPRTKLAIEAQAQAASDWSFAIRAALTNVAADKHHYYGGASTLSAFGVAIANGVTDTHYPTSLLPGLAHLWAACDNSGVDVIFRIETYNSDGTRAALVAQDRLVTTTRANLDFIIPAKGWRLLVINSSGAAQTYYFCVTSLGHQQ